MPSLANATDNGLRNLDPRVIPQWELLEFGPNRKTYEQELFQSVICEFTDISGWPVDIYLYTPTRQDIFYGESTIGEFDGPYRTKMLFEAPTESYLINIMGLTGGDVIQNAEIPKAIWCRDVLAQVNKKYDLDFDPTDRSPLIGDMVHILYNNQRFEIASFGSGARQFLGTKNTWTCVLKPYRVGNEGPTEKEAMFDTTPLATETDERNDTFSVFTNLQQNEQKRRINKMANSEKKEKVEETYSPDAKNTAYYGYFNGIKK